MAVLGGAVSGHEHGSSQPGAMSRATSARRRLCPRVAAQPVHRLDQVRNADRRRVVDTFEARTLLALQLQQLHHLGGLVGRGDRAQLAAGVAEHDPGRVGGQQLDAEPDQPVQQVDDVVVGNFPAISGDCNLVATCTRSDNSCPRPR